MGWICKECSQETSYRYSTCINCKTPISKHEIKCVVSQEIKIQKIKIKDKQLKNLLWISKSTDLILARGKKIKLVFTILLLGMIAIRILIPQNFDIAKYNQLALNRISIKTKVLTEDFLNMKEKKQLQFRENFAKKLKQEILVVKGEIVTRKVQEAYSDIFANGFNIGRIQNIKKKSIIFNKGKVLEEKLWKALWIIQSFL